MEKYSKLNNVTIKITVEGNQGTGIILKNNQDIFIITAKHCLEDSNKQVTPNTEITVGFYNVDSKVLENVVFSSQDYDLHLPEKHNIDIAILKIKGHQELFKQIPAIRLANDIFEVKTEFIMRGFPNILAGLPHNLDLKFKDKADLSFEVKVSDETFDTSEKDYEDMMKGYSGSGVFFHLNQELYLVGTICTFLPDYVKFKAFNIASFSSLLPEISIFNQSNIPFESSNIELTNDLRRQLSEVEEYIQHYKVVTAKKEVEAIKNAISFSSLPQKVKEELLAECDFLDGIILRIISKDKPKSDELIIKAHTLQPDNIKYQERVAQVYYDISKEDPKVSILIEKVLAKDPFNPRMWSLKQHICNEVIEIPDIVKNKPLFIYHKFVYRNGANKRIMYNELQIEFGHITESVETPSLEDINSENFNYYFFLGVYLLCIDNVKIRRRLHGKNSEVAPVTNKVRKGRDILGIIYQKVRTIEMPDSQLAKQADFFYELAQYRIEPSQKRASRLYVLFIDDDFILTKLAKAYDIAFALLDHDLYNETIEVIEKSKIEEEDPSFYLLRAEALEKLGEESESMKYIEKYLSEMQKIDALALSNMFDTIVKLMSEGYESNHLITLLRNKIYTDDYYEDLLKGWILCFDVKNHVESKTYVYKLINIWDRLEEIQKFTVIVILSDIGDLEKAIELARPILDQNTENVHLEIFIHNLWHCTKYSQELYDLLQKWRLNFSPKLILLRYELDICYRLGNHDKIEEICLYGLKHFKENELLIAGLVRVLYIQNKLSDIPQYLDDSILKLKLTSVDASNLSIICIRVGKPELGLELAYLELKKNYENVSSQMQYWSIYRHYESSNSVIKYETVELGTTVGLKVGIETLIYDVTNESIKNNPIIKEIYQKKLNDTVLIQNKYQDDKVTISFICDKYSGEVAKIIKKTNDPLSGGLPVKSLKIITNEDDSIDIEGTNQMLQQQFGEQGLLDKWHRDKTIEEYQNDEIGFLHLCNSFFSGNPFDCFEAIIQDVNLGITLAPILKQKRFEINQDTSYVLDFSTILLFHKLNDDFDFDGYKFIIAQSTKDIIIDTIRELENDSKVKMSIAILPDKVTPIFFPDNYVENKIKKIKSVLEWVDRYCQVEYPDFLLDDEYVLDVSTSNDVSKKFIIHTLLLANKPNRIFITDDIFYYENPVFNCNTSEHFFKCLNSQMWEMVKLKMVEMNYKGITLTSNTLIQVFDKSRVITSINRHLLPNALKSLRGVYNSDVNNVKEAILFIKYLFAINLENAQRKAITKQIFVSILQEPYFEISRNNLEVIHEMIDKELFLLGNAPDIVKKCLSDALRDLQSGN